MFASRMSRSRNHCTSTGEPKLYFERPSKRSPGMTEGIDAFGLFMLVLVGSIVCSVIAGTVVCLLK